MSSVASGDQDFLIAPPALSAKSWAVANASTGEILFSYRPDSQLPIASLTKVMTALIVLDSSDELSDKAVVSDRADRTFGTSANVMVGERLSIGDLLYGLLLPSGNDAAVVLAEYFGRRIAREPGVNSYAGFISQMNAKAKYLGMSNTHFEDPHGLGNNVSTARDLLKLGHVAMKNATFRRYVSTQSHPIAIRSTKGIVRNVRWKNTNKLLGQRYFDGIKTGHSNPADGCLLLSGSYNNKKLHVVVLGSSSEETRFTDAYNLFQWASRRLQAES